MTQVTLESEISEMESFLKNVKIKRKKEQEYLYRTGLRMARALGEYRLLDPQGHFAKIFRIGFARQRAVVIQFEDGFWFGSFESGKKQKDRKIIDLLRKLLNIK